MPPISANLGFLFPDRPLLERFAAARAAGFRAVELHWPYEHPAETVAAVARAAGVEVLALNTSVGDAAADEFGLAAVPGREADFRAGFERALAYAEALGAGAIHVMAGNVDAGARAEAEATFRANLAFAATRGAASGRTILIEPINRFDKPRYHLATSAHALEVIAALGAANVKMMFDVYHLQLMEGHLTRTLVTSIGHIGHVQIAAVPDRGEPDRGEVSLAHVMATLEAIGYAGHVGAEYKPRGRTEDGLGWAVAYGISSQGA